MDTGPRAVEHGVQVGRIVVAAQVDPIQKIGTAGVNDRWSICRFIGGNVVVVGSFRLVKSDGYDRALRIADRVAADGDVVGAGSPRSVEKNPSRTVATGVATRGRSEEHTSELQSLRH